MNCRRMTPSRAVHGAGLLLPASPGFAVTGGLIPEACGWNNVFAGAHYVYGDSGGGFIRALPMNAARTGFASAVPIQVATGSGPVSFRMGPDGSLYVVLIGAGAVHRFTPIDQDGAVCNRAVPSGSAELGARPRRAARPRGRARGRAPGADLGFPACLTSACSATSTFASTRRPAARSVTTGTAPLPDPAHQGPQVRQDAQVPADLRPRRRATT